MASEKKGRRPRLGDLRSAVGVYVNYLRVGNVVVVPAYNRLEDDLAMRKLKHVLPDTEIFQVLCRSLAEKGGVLN